MSPVTDREQQACSLLEGGRGVQTDRHRGISNTGSSESLFWAICAGSARVGVAAWAAALLQQLSELCVYGRGFQLRQSLGSACLLFSAQRLFSQPVSTWTLAEFSCSAPVLGSLLRQPCSVHTKCSHWAFADLPLPFVLSQVSFVHKECLRPVWSGRAPSWGFGGYSGLGWLIWRCRSKLYLELCTIIIYIIIIYLEIIKG